MAKFSTFLPKNGMLLDVGTATNIEFVYGTQTAQTGAWTGVSKDQELYDGKQIMYFLPQESSGNATLNLTFAPGTNSGAKNIYFKGSTRVTTQCEKGSLILLTYRRSFLIDGQTYEGWWAFSQKENASYDASTHTLTI